MKVLVVGGNGSIGQRYCAILRYLAVPFDVWDITGDVDRMNGPNMLRECCGHSFDRAIIAAPTPYHAAYCHALYDLETPFLCEKPLSKNLDQCEDLAYRDKRSSTKGHVVNNYRFVFKKFKVRDSIEYNFYKTGGDGILWDLCQLIYIADSLGVDFHYKTSSPVWTLKTANKRIPYREIEKSYIYMIATWLKGGDGLWSINEGLHMSAAVQRFKRDENSHRNTSKKQKLKIK